MRRVRGALIVEAAIVFPIIIAIVLAIIYYGMIQLQVGIIEDVCETYGLELIRRFEISGIEFLSESQNFSDVNRCMKEINPYRHLARKDMNVYENELKEKLDKYNFIIDDYEIGIRNQRYKINHILIIEIENFFEAPFFMKQFGIDFPEYKIKKKFCNFDKGDLIRNTDYIYSIGNEIFEKNDILNKLSKFGVGDNNDEK